MKPVLPPIPRLGGRKSEPKYQDHRWEARDKLIYAVDKGREELIGVMVSSELARLAVMSHNLERIDGFS